MVHQAYKYNGNQVYDYNDLKQHSTDDFGDEEVSKKCEKARGGIQRDENDILLMDGVVEDRTNEVRIQFGMNNFLYFSQLSHNAICV